MKSQLLFRDYMDCYKAATAVITVFGAVPEEFYDKCEEKLRKLHLIVELECGGLERVDFLREQGGNVPLGIKGTAAVKYFKKWFRANHKYPKK